MRYSHLCSSLAAAVLFSLTGCHNQTAVNPAPIPMPSPAQPAQPSPSIPGAMQPVTSANAAGATVNSSEGVTTTNRATASIKPAALKQTLDEITLNLGMPANVKVYQGDTLFQQQKYTRPGTYVINASQWPDGIYQVVVQSGGGLSQVVMRQSFVFTKPGNLNASLNIQN